MVLLCTFVLLVHRWLRTMVFSMSESRYGSGVLKRHESTLFISDHFWLPSLVFMNDRAVKDMMLGQCLVYFLRDPVLSYT